ncbi:MAG: PQQ-dependent sugar dehydrogenase [Rhodomicrobium sp.]
MYKNKVLAFLSGALCSAMAGSLALAQTGDPVRGRALFGEQCTLCHTDDGTKGLAPNLIGVLGRRIASTDFNYSAAMRARNWNWDEAILDSYLMNPQAMLPGIEMPFSIPDASERRDIIAYIGTLTSAAKPAESVSVFGDWRQDRPGRRYKISLDDLPMPYETRSAGNPPREVKRPVGTKPKAPDGFTVTLFAEGLESPRLIRTAPNGDLFVAETLEGRISILRPGADGELAKNEVYASGLSEPFGIAFYPAGPNPKWVYVAESNRVIRFAYKNGDLKPKLMPEIAVRALAPTLGGHVTRDVAFSNDGKRMFVSVGSSSNDAEGMPVKTQREIDAWQARKGIGAAWSFEENRADVLVFTPEGKDGSVFATGLRNCAGLAVQPETGDLYCATNERDGLGDNLPPDYVTRVREGQFFGWPWLYMGDHEDPRWKNARPGLAVMVTNPDVLLQPHSAPLGMSFLDGASFPPEYHGSAFVALHGSWNRTERTGYKVVRVIMRDGVPTGEYEDFLTGFVIDETRVWGRPVGVAEGKDGALYVSEDAGGTIWRVVFAGPAEHRASKLQQGQ